MAFPLLVALRDQKTFCRNDLKENYQMFKKALQVVSIAVFVSGLMVAGGCRGLRGGGGDLLDPEGMGGSGIPLSERFEDGIRIHDVNFASVQFGYDSFQIAGSQIGRIEAVADYMKQNSGVRLITEGHCDERGSREYNLSLGEHRAHAVRAHLVRLGIDGERIQTRSYGEEKPIDPGHNEKAWWQNRRVEFALYR